MKKTSFTEKADIILLAGQSNAEGYGIGDTNEPYQPDDRILMLCPDVNVGFTTDENGNETFGVTSPFSYSLGVAKEQEKDGNKLGCLALSFAREYKKRALAENRSIIIVQTALGATGFEKGVWGVGKVLHNRMIEMTSYALGLNKENRLVAILWHQGEHEVVLSTAEDLVSEHAKNLSDTLCDIRKNFGNAPFITAGFCKDWEKENAQRCALLNTAVKRTVANDVCAAYVESDTTLLSNNEKTGNKDQIHFSREALYSLGEKFFEQFEKIK